MKKLAMFLTLAATPALAHEGHAVMPGSGGHALAHLAMAGGAAAVVWLGVTLYRRAAERFGKD